METISEMAAFTFSSNYFPENFLLEYDPTLVLPPDDVSVTMGIDAVRRVDMGRLAKQMDGAYPMAFESVIEPRFLDAGCGSGVIALSLAGELQRSSVPPAEIVCFDLSPDAVACSNANFDRISCYEVGLRAIQGDWYDKEFLASLGTFDEILLNPPYLPPTEKLEGIYEQTPETATTARDVMESMIEAVGNLAPLLRPMGSITLRSSSRFGQWAGMRVFSAVRNPADLFETDARLKPMGRESKLGMLQTASRHTSGYGLAHNDTRVFNAYHLLRQGKSLEEIERTLGGFIHRDVIFDKL